MSTVYYAGDYTNPMPDLSNAGGLLVRPFWFQVATALAANDTVKLCRIPGSMGIQLIDIDVEVPALDTGSLIVLELGDNESATRFLTTTLAGSIGQTGVPGRIARGPANTTPGAGTGNLVFASVPRTYTADDDLVLTVQTGPSTGATGEVIFGWISYIQFGVTPLF